MVICTDKHVYSLYGSEEYISSWKLAGTKFPVTADGLLILLQQQQCIYLKKYKVTILYVLQIAMMLI